MAYRFVAAFLLFLSFAGQAADIVWVKLTPFLNYRDIDTNCKTEGYFHHYFGAEIEQRKVKAAVLKAGGMQVFHRSISLNKAELAGLRFDEDSFERSWLTSFTVSERLIRWILENSGSSLDGCRPTQPMVAVSPAPFEYVFKMESLGPGPQAISSNFGKFGGTRKDGRAYQAGFYFTQEQL